MAAKRVSVLGVVLVMAVAGLPAVTLGVQEGGAALGLARVAEAQAGAPLVLYEHDFTTAPGTEWSHRGTTVAPRGQRFLGEFGNDRVTLTVPNVAAGDVVKLTFDLYLLRSWDGHGGVAGPDIWTLSVDGGQRLLHTTFSNCHQQQAYPGTYPSSFHSPGTGTFARSTLGYNQLCAPSIGTDSTYRLTFEVTSPGQLLRLVFEGSNLQALSDESWGLDNVKVTSDGPPAQCRGAAALQDTDGDGLTDCWETWGVDADGDDRRDLVLDLVDSRGVRHTADPIRKDLFVEVDWMECRDFDVGWRLEPVKFCGHSAVWGAFIVLGSGLQGDVIGHLPAGKSLDKVVEAFARAPVDGTGVRLHLVLDEGVPHVEHLRIGQHEYGPGSLYHLKHGEQGVACDGHFGLAGHRAAPRCGATLRAWAMVARYGLFAHALGNGYETRSGIAEAGGNDVLVTLGASNPQVSRLLSGQVETEAGIFMHELGHGLRLHHGGPDHLGADAYVNCKPNYLSVMSYTQMTPALMGRRPLDFSRSVLPDLDESRLNENQPLQPVDGWTHTVYRGLGGLPAVGRLGGSINWNNNLFANEHPVSADINNVLTFCDEAAGIQYLRGADDWPHLQYEVRDGVVLSNETAVFPGALAAEVARAPEDAILDEIAEGARHVDADEDGLSNADDACPLDPEPDPIEGALDGCPERALTRAVAAASPPAAGVWTRGAWDVTLDCSGCVTEFDVDGERTFGYDGPFRLVAEGLHTLAYQSADGAGSREPWRSMTLGIDLTPPRSVVEAASSEPSDGGWTRGAWSLAGACEDPPGGAPATASGCVGITARVDGAGAVPFEGLSLDTEGRHLVEIRSVDLAGNLEPGGELPLGVDRTPPGTSLAPVATGPRAGLWTSGTWLAEVRCADPLAGAPAGASGCAFTEAASGGSPFAVVPGLEVVEEGLATVRHRGTDRAGNTGAEAATVLGVDRTAPTARVHGAGDLGVVQVFQGILLGRTLVASAEDRAGEGPGAGVAALCFQVDSIATGSAIAPFCAAAAKHADGTWRAEVGTIPRGTYEVRAVPVDAVGNVGGSDPMILVVGG